jgi:predicted aldo/keto reductase-like oxidoreductase
MAAAYGMADFGRYRYGMFERRDPETGGRTGGAGHWFPGVQGDFCTDCGECVPRCPLNLAVSELVKQTHSALVGEAGRRLWG